MAHASEARLRAQLAATLRGIGIESSWHLGDGAHSHQPAGTHRADEPAAGRGGRVPTRNPNPLHATYRQRARARRASGQLRRTCSTMRECIHVSPTPALPCRSRYTRWHWEQGSPQCSTQAEVTFFVCLYSVADGVGAKLQHLAALPALRPLLWNGIVGVVRELASTPLRWFSTSVHGADDRRPLS